MFGIDRRAARAVWTAALVLLLLCLFWAVRTTIFVFIVALLFAYLISPLVDLLDRFLPSRATRTVALALAYIIFIAAVAVAGTAIGSRVAEQAGAFAQRLPAMLQQWERAAPGPQTQIASFKAEALARAQAEIARRGSELLSALPQAGMKILALASNLIYVVIVPVLAFFFLKDAAVMRQHVLDLVDDSSAKAALGEMLEDAHLLLAHYMRSLVLLSLATFVAYSVFFSIMGVPYGVLLATIAFLLEFIPTLGPLAACLTILLVAAVSGGQILAILIFLVIFRMFQDYVLSPHLIGRGLEVHPLWMLFGVFAGAEAAGVPGAFLSVPALALVRLVYLRVRKARLAARANLA